SSNETIYFEGVLSELYTGNGLRVVIHYAMASATSGDIDWDGAFERIGDQQLDINSDSFATAKSVDNTSVPSTAGLVDVVSIDFSDGAEIDGLQAGEEYRLAITRDAASDTASGDAQITKVEV